GVAEEVVGRLTSQPYSWTISPRIESYAVIAETKATLPLLGIDLIAEGTRLGLQKQLNSEATTNPEATKAILERDSIWVGENLGKRAQAKLTLLINDRAATYTVRGTFPDGGEPAIVMDIAAAQVVLGKRDRVDRIFIREPPPGAASANGDKPLLETWRSRAQNCLPAGVSLRAAGASTEENRKMLSAFRWNLRLLSYVA